MSDQATNTSATATETPVVSNSQTTQSAQIDGNQPDSATQPALQDPPAGEVPPQAQTPEAKDFSRQFAAIVRREKEAEKKIQFAKTEVERARAEAEKYKTEASENKVIVDALRSGNPVEALSKLGLDFNELSKRVLNDGRPSLESQLAETQKRLADMEEKREQDRLAADRANTQLEIRNFQNKIKSTVDNAGDAYELIRTHEAYGEVFDLIAGYFERTQEVMDMNTAASMIEKQLEADAEKVLSAKKIKAKFMPKPPPQTAGQANTSANTLTNDLAATPSRVDATQTFDQRRQRLIEKLERQSA